MKSDILYRLEKEGFVKLAETTGNQRVNQLIADYIDDRPFYIAKGEAFQRGAVGLIRFEDGYWISPKSADIDGMNGDSCPWFTATEVEKFLIEVEEKPIELMYVALARPDEGSSWSNLDLAGKESSTVSFMTSEEAHNACKSFLRKNIKGKAAIMKMVATAVNETVPQTIFTEVN